MTRIESIASDRLRVLPFGEQHLTPRYVGWLNDADVVRFSEQRFLRHTLESCREYWASFAGTPNYFWAIELRYANTHIGNINAYVDEAHGVADVGILIGDKGCWGQGYGTEAWTAVLRWLIDHAGMRKVTGGTLACNTGMLAVMEQAGMVDDGRRVRHVLVDGQETDVVYKALFSPRKSEMDEVKKGDQ